MPGDGRAVAGDTEVSGSVALANGGNVPETGEVTAEAVRPAGGLSSGMARDAARAASILASNSKSSRVPSKAANSRSPSLAVLG
jgi:hypothetical protein